jgi:TrmH family RNA methyltransferase
MISERKKKLLASLQHKKYRAKHGMFLLEGEKIILDALAHSSTNTIKLSEVYATPEWIDAHRSIFIDRAIQPTVLHHADLKRITTLVTPQEVIATAPLPGKSFNEEVLADGSIIALDRVRDPGNLGTIIRTADWFGFRSIVCSPDTVDAFNTKVVQASMGAVLRTNVYYEKLEAVIERAKKHGIECMGTTMEGEDLYAVPIPTPVVIIAGNESAGISEGIKDLLDREITIPSTAGNVPGSESLNVAMAVSIVCSEIRRRERR